MKKKTIIISQKQLDEISGGNAAYLDGLSCKPDIANVFGTEVTTDGTTDGGYAKPTTTDDAAKMKTNNWRGNAWSHGMGGYGLGALNMREEDEKMSVKEWREKYLSEDNARLVNKRFGAGGGDNGKSYDATKVNLHRLNQAEKTAQTGATPAIKAKAAQTASTMRKNWDNIDVAKNQYNAAKANDKAIMNNKPEGEQRKRNPLPTPPNGLFLNE